MRLGWKAGPEQYPPNELLDYAVAAEEAGFDSIDVSDHFHPWSESGQACFTWTWLGAVAAKTSKIQLGTGLTCPILRYHPSIVAQAAATLSCLAPERVFLGVGTGEALNEYAAVGAWPSFRERQQRLAEAIALIRALFTGEQVTHEGQYYQTHKARLYTPPASSIPIYVSSLVPASAKFAGDYGDGLLTVGGKGPEIYRRMLELFDEGGGGMLGKKGATRPKMIELNVAYAADRAQAIAAQRQYWAGAFVPALYSEKIYTPKMSEQNGEVVGDDTIARLACISNDPDEQVAFAKKYIDLGFDHLVFHSAGPDQEAFIEGFGREVLPRIRSMTTKAEAVDAA
jgi:coenzyme F420-dependent glucose-6-phosphate dehydrogenase